MSVPTYFRSGGNERIVVYDYLDIAEGTGVVQFHCVRVNTGSTNYSYVLTHNSAFVSSVAAAAAASFDCDFDVTFNENKEIKGTAYVVFSLVVQATGNTGTVTAQVRKWDGTTETNISDAIVSQPQTAGGDYAKQTFSLAVPCTTTTFKKGETLRLNITVAIGGGGNGTLTHTIDADYPSFCLVPFNITQ